LFCLSFFHLRSLITLFGVPTFHKTFYYYYRYYFIQDYLPLTFESKISLQCLSPPCW
jgi:hypothetical protein